MLHTTWYHRTTASKAKAFTTNKLKIEESKTYSHQHSTHLAMTCQHHCTILEDELRNLKFVSIEFFYKIKF